MARIINSGDLTPAALQALPQHDLDCIYNGLDCCVTLEVLKVLLGELDETSSETYAFSRALQGPIIDMAMRGIRIDFRKRDAVLAEFEARREKVGNALDRIIREGIGVDIDWNSPKQLMNLFYDVMQFKPIRKRNPKGMLVPTINRDAIEKLQSHYYAGPLCAHLLLLRDLNKKIGFLKTGIDPDGRIRAGFNIAGTTTGRLSSSMSEFGTGTNLQNVDRDLKKIFIADPGYKFVNLDLEQGDSRNVGAIIWNLFYESHGATEAGKYLDACESGDLHTTVCSMAWSNLPWPGDAKGNRDIADGIAYRNFSYRDLAKKLGHGCLTEDHEVLTPTGWVSIATKPSIIMTWSEHYSAFDTVTHWTDKTYNGTMCNFEGNSISARMTADHRVPYKADQRSSGVKVRPALMGPQCFMPLGSGFTGGTVSPKARLIAAVMSDAEDCGEYVRFHLYKSRKVKRLYKLCQQYGVKIEAQAGDKYKVYFSCAKKAGPYMFDWTAEALDDFLDEYKFWDGHVGLTSISLFSTDRTHLEWLQTFGRLRGIGGQIQKPKTSGFGSTVYGLQQNKRQYANGASVGFAKDEVENLQVYCPTVSSSFFYVRRNGKIYVTGNSNYLGQPKTMAGHSKVEQPLIEDFQDRYFGAFPLIGSTYGRSHEPNWHNWVKKQIWDFGYITSLMGRRRFFYGNPADESTLREAVAYEPQSLTGDEINTGMLRIWRQFPWVQLLCQVHDSILLQVPEEMSDDVIQLLLDTLRITLLLKGGREFSVPTEAKVGWNWGDAPGEKEISRGAEPNPDGMIKWKGADLRRRTERPLEKVGGKLTLRGML